MDPEAVDVEAPQEWRKPHKHDYAKNNEVTHGIIDKSVDLETFERSTICATTQKNNDAPCDASTNLCPVRVTMNQR
jgi:hypothetical protein